MRYLACEKCKGPVRVDDGSFSLPNGTVCQHLNAPRQHNSESVMTIFRGPNGEVSIPWERNTPCPSGYVVEEIKGARAVRRLEKELDAKDIKRYKDYQLKQEAIFGRQRAQRREDLKQIVRDGVTVIEGRTVHVTEFGRAMARHKLDQLNKQSFDSDRYDPGNYRRE